MGIFKNLINKIHNQASSNNPVMFDYISKFDAHNMEERAMYKKGGYMMGWKPYDRNYARPNEKEND